MGLLRWVMPLTVRGHPWQYSSQLHWQWTKTPLTQQDSFCLGGRTTVRGFDGQQTLCGDRGQLLRQELATGLPSEIQQAFPFLVGTQVYAALDAGRATNSAQDVRHRLSGIALGVRGFYRINDAYPLQWDIFVGKPLARPDGFTTAQHAAGFALQAEF
jgi:hemolysin activation/secretion protein